MTYWAERIQTWALLRPDETALYDSASKLTWKDVEDTTATLCSRLRSEGVQEKDSVTLVLARSTTTAIAIASLLRANLIGLVIDREIERCLLPHVYLDKPKAILFRKMDGSRIQSLFGATSDYRHVHILGEIHALVRKHSPTIAAPESLRWLLQTSGTTRTPLTVMIDELNMIERATGETRDFEININDRILNILSFAHDLGLNQLLTCLSIGASLYIHQNPFSRGLDQALRSERFDTITGTPVVWNELLKLNPEPYPRLRLLTVSGGSLPSRQFQLLTSIFPSTAVFRTYGQTETFRSLCNNRTHDDNLGKPIAGVHLTIINEKFEQCSVDDIGELVHFGSGSMLGYRGDAIATERKMFNGGIRTGDRFRQDSSGQFHYCGRLDDLIKRWDQRLHLGEIEAVVSDLNCVNTAVAIATAAPPEDPRQNLVYLFVCLAEKADCDANRILQYCKSNLTSYKVPDRVILVDQLPYTSSNKIDRRLLLERSNMELKS